MKFNFQDVWNSTLERPQKPNEARDHLWASELGGSMIDRYLKLKGEPYTNPPNSRSMRKFFAGDIWEWIVKIVLVKAGLQFTQQEHVRVEYEGLLPITGKIDFIVSGTAKESDVSDLPEMLQPLAKGINEAIRGQVFERNIIEIKSVGSFVFEGLLAQDNPKTNHMLQGAIYKKATGLPTDIIYVCRDDARILQYNIDKIFPELEDIIIKDLEEITDFYKTDVEPPKENLIIFENGKFKKNWKVEYSPYLSKLYSRKKNEDDKEETFFEIPMDYSDWATPIVSGMNRVYERVKAGKEMTKSNQEWIEKAKLLGFDLLTM